VLLCPRDTQVTSKTEFPILCLQFLLCQVERGSRKDRHLSSIPYVNGCQAWCRLLRCRDCRWKVSGIRLGESRAEQRRSKAQGTSEQSDIEAWHNLNLAYLTGDTCWKEWYTSLTFVVFKTLHYSKLLEIHYLFPVMLGNGQMKPWTTSSLALKINDTLRASNLTLGHFKISTFAQNKHMNTRNKNRVPQRVHFISSNLGGKEN